MPLDPFAECKALKLIIGFVIFLNESVILFNQLVQIFDQVYINKERGVAIFAKDFSGHPARKNQQKCTRPLMPSAAPIRPRHLVSTQQGVET